MLGRPGVKLTLETEELNEEAGRRTATGKQTHIRRCKVNGARLRVENKKRKMPGDFNFCGWSVDLTVQE
jgi:hypothetical protein